MYLVPPLGESLPPPAASSVLLVQACTLLQPDEPTGLLVDQDILIRGQRIAALGPTGQLGVDGAGEIQVIAGKGLLAVPGLINAHTHSPENVLAASSLSLPLELWLIPLFANALEWSPRLAYLSALLGAVEMLKTGTTAVLDHLWTVEGVAREYLDAVMSAYRDAGLRAAVAPSIEDRDLVLEVGRRAGVAFPSHLFTERFLLWPPIEAQMEALEDFVSTWHNAAEGRLRCLVGPSGIHWCSPTLLEACLRLAERYNIGLHLHAVESRLQAAVIHEALGEGGIAFLRRLGLLKPGTSLAHAIWLEAGDLELLAETGTTVVHNPVSNLRLGSGRFPLIEARRRGVQVALGSDGAASNDTQHMFEVLKLTGLIHNQPDVDYQTWPSPHEILSFATTGGAAALGIPTDVGSIAPGQLADLVLLNLATDAFFPLRDPALHLVYRETGHSVDTVIVDGKVLVQHGILTTVDEQALRTELQACCRPFWSGSLVAPPQEASTRSLQAAFRAVQNLLVHRMTQIPAGYSTKERSTL
jgi:5-methylthioadenosine/S-adenosylhomocysteine deaminase